MVFKRKQIVVLSLVMMIVIAGYLQYSYKKSSISVSEIADSDSPRLGEAVYVDNTEVLDNEVAETTGDTANKDIKKEDNKKEDNKKEDNKKEDNKKEDNKKEDNKKADSKKTVQASKVANDFFAQAKMDRDVTRGKNKDELQGIIGDPESSKELKSQANDKMLAIIDSSEREMAIETLIKEKGFSDVVVFVADDGSLDIVVKTQSLTDAEATQIADIAARQANVSIANIHVRDIF